MFILIGIPLFWSFNPVFPLRLNSKPSPDFTVFWVLSSIKALIRHEIREVKLTIRLLNSNEFSKTTLCKTAPVADKTTVVEYNVYRSYPYISFLNQICVFNILSIHTLSGFSRFPCQQSVNLTLSRWGTFIIIIIIIILIIIVVVIVIVNFIIKSLSKIQSFIKLPIRMVMIFTLV